MAHERGFWRHKTPILKKNLKKKVDDYFNFVHHFILSFHFSFFLFSFIFSFFFFHSFHFSHLHFDFFFLKIMIYGNN